MMQPSKTKICLVGDSLSGGGAERSHGFLSVYFDSKGIEVHNIIVLDSIFYKYAGQLLNLGKLKGRSNGVVNKAKRLRVFNAYIKQHNFDYIIDFRMRTKPLQDFIIARYIYTSPSIFSVRSSHLDWYMPRQSWLTRLLYDSCYGIHCLTTKMALEVKQQHGLKNVFTINNALDTEFIDHKLFHNHENTIKGNFILATGRMDEIKQFDKLIEVYAASVLPGNNVSLVLLGDGILKEDLMQLAQDKGLADKVIFKGFTENPYIYMRDALYFVLCSKFEGMPMVVLEAFACGTPVVSFDCMSGPSEIITDRHNGLLIADQDTGALRAGMNTLFEDKELYTHCKQNARASIEKFSLENIGRQWMEYLKIAIN